MTADEVPPAAPAAGEGDGEALEAIRSILISTEQERLQQLQAANAALRQRVRELQSELGALDQRVEAETKTLPARLPPLMSDVMSRTIRDSRDDMAEALAPVIGESIRVQIRDSRQDMIEALYPIIGEAIQKAIAEFTRELQRNIDQRLKTTFGPEGAMRTISARLRGVSRAELTLREALPFSIRDIFLIQRGSGLLLAHAPSGSEAASDSDLISGMLNAVRDFAGDSFGQAGAPDEHLDEVQYGDRRIIIQDGQAAYLAAVIDGVEPTGFRGVLRQFVSDLHLRHHEELQAYVGDPATLPNLQPKLNGLIADTSTAETGPARRPLGRGQKLALAAGGLFALLLVSLACFYAQFTLALLPVAFPGPPTLTATATLPSTATLPGTATLPASATAAPTLPATGTPAPTTAPTGTPAPASSPTPRPTFAEPPPLGEMIGNSWVRGSPSAAAARLTLVEQGTSVRVLAMYGTWAEIQWDEAEGTRQGWVPVRWVAAEGGAIPAARITPTDVP